jgi:hypothetical protein
MTKTTHPSEVRLASLTQNEASKLQILMGSLLVALVAMLF